MEQSLFVSGDSTGGDKFAHSKNVLGQQDDVGRLRQPFSAPTGDSGGPFLVKESSGNQTIYGITSYGREPGSNPGVYVDVYNMLEEINQLLAECS